VLTSLVAGSTLTETFTMAVYNLAIAICLMHLIAETLMFGLGLFL